MAKMLGCLKKTAALVMTIALIMMELVLPMAALASDLTTLPILTISALPLPPGAPAAGVPAVSLAHPGDGG